MRAVTRSVRAPPAVKMSLSSLAIDPEVPIERVAFAIAADVYPALDLDAFEAELDALAAPMLARRNAPRDPRGQAQWLCGHVQGTLGFQGDSQTYYDPRNSFVPWVLARRRGIPISLAIVMMAIGRRAGIPVEGVGFPGHFLARVGGPEGVLVDPFHRGPPLETAALERLARRALGPDARVQPEHLQTCANPAIAARMLANLDAIYTARGERALAMLVNDRLYELTDDPLRLRNRGLHARALGAISSAEADLSAYLCRRPDAPDRASVLRALEDCRRALGAAH
jgi:regulator of sirC expression with transglutaminase-like and TPR domain